VCATISKQIYKAKSGKDFDLTDTNHHKVEVLHFYDHGILENTVPPFVIALSTDHNALILGWRGSSTLMDWTSDLAFAPVSSSRWNKIAPNVRAHGAYSALVESDLALYEEIIIKAIKDNNVSQLILTGHSLAGGMAYVAHVFIEGQLFQPDSIWSKSQIDMPTKLTCRTVAFSAPMTILNLNPIDDATNKFLKKVGDNSCNIIFNCDIVPHAVGDLEFLNDVMIEVIHDIEKNIPVWGIIKWLISAQKQLEKKYEGLVEEHLKSIFDVLLAYQQIGSVIYYHDKQATPVRLQDTRPGKLYP
jgi:hypothetical protein